MARFVGTRTPPTTATPYNSGGAVTQYADRVTGLVFSNTAGNLFVDQSTDGSNWDHTDTVAVVASTGKAFSYEIYAPYYRVRYVPTTNPTVFRLAARLASAGSRP